MKYTFEPTKARFFPGLLSNPRSTLINLHNRTIIYLPRTEHIINQTENNRTERANNTKVHRRDGDFPGRRPETKEHGDGHVDHSERVDGNAEEAGQVERAPDELGADGVDDGGFAAARVADSACAAAVEEEAGDHHVGKI